MNETPENRLKRLHMRSWRRGIKEMDLILGSFADSSLKNLNSDQLELYESLLVENDQDLYPWFNGMVPCPPKHVQIMEIIRNATIIR